MTKEEFEAIVRAQIEKHAQAKGVEMTEQMRTIIADEVKTALKINENKIKHEESPEDAVDPKGGFKLFSEFCKAVAIADMSQGRRVDKRLHDLDVKAAGSPTLEEGDPAASGYLIPTEFRNEILMRAQEKNDILNRCMQIPMATGSIDIPFVNGFNESGDIVHGGIEWKWIAEKGALTATKPELGLIGLKLKTVTGLAYVTDQLLEDSPISMENFLRVGFADGLNYQIMKVLLKGSGAGQPLGILNAPSTVSVPKEAGPQKAKTIVFENIVNMYARLYGDAGGVWMANRDCLPQLATMSLTVGTGGVPVFMPAGGLSGSPFDTLFGLPLLWNRQCKTLGTVGDIVLCDWSQYLVGMKAGQSGMQMSSSIHIKFDYMQTAFRFSFRMDGQPWWKSALQGPESEKTVSPFITLATRA